MPKATIYKDCEALFTENEVWIAEYRNMAPPACYVVTAENANQDQFCPLVPPSTDVRHN